MDPQRSFPDQVLEPIILFPSTLSSNNKCLEHFPPDSYLGQTPGFEGPSSGGLLVAGGSTTYLGTQRRSPQGNALTRDHTVDKFQLLMDSLLQPG